MKLNFAHIVLTLTTLFMGTLAINAEAQPARQTVPASQESPTGMLTLESENDQPGVSFSTNVVYAKYDETEVKLHFIAPSSATNPVPLIVYVPGSAWFPQDLDRAVPNMIEFAKQTGYAVAIVAYRPSTIAKSPAQLVDIKASIRFLRANAKRFNIDPEKIAIWGTSSGGHMASLVGVTEGIEKFLTDDNRDQSSGVKAVVDFFGPTNFVKMSDYPSSMNHDEATSPESSVIGGLIQDPSNREKVEEYNPITYVSADKKLPPFLIMHGDVDPLVPFNQSVLFYEALRDAKQDVAFYKIVGAGHGNRFMTPQTLKIVKAFLAQHLQ